MLSNLFQITDLRMSCLRRIEKVWLTSRSVMWKLTSGRSSPQSCIECGMCMSEPLYYRPVVRCSRGQLQDQIKCLDFLVFHFKIVQLRAPDTKLLPHPLRTLPLVVPSKAGRAQYPARSLRPFGSAILVRGDQRGDAGFASCMFNMRKSLV